jgi:hypothetical protein
MELVTGTEKVVAVDVEALFREFVRNANRIGAGLRTKRASPPKSAGLEAPEGEPAPDGETSGRVVLLTRRKGETPSTDPEVTPKIEPKPADVVKLREPGSDTQRLEAQKIVPNVAEMPPPAEPLKEKSEDGQMPPRELDRFLSDMTVLLRYGYDHDVAGRIDALRQRYPEDLLLLRRIAEFHIEQANKVQALDCLFKLAAGLFERRNVHGMRRALEQVLVLDPKNQRAYKLLGLLSARPATGS